jgi:fructokinase
MTAEAARYVLGVELGGSFISLSLGSASTIWSSSGSSRWQRPRSPSLAEYRSPRTQERFGFRALGIASFGPLDLDPSSPNYGAIMNSSKSDWSGTNLLGWARQFDCPSPSTRTSMHPHWRKALGAARGLRNWAHVVVDAGIGVGSSSMDVPSEGTPMRSGAHAGAQPRADLPASASITSVRRRPRFQPRIRSASGSGCRGSRSRPSIWPGVTHVLSAMCHNLCLRVCPERILLEAG